MGLQQIRQAASWVEERWHHARESVAIACQVDITLSDARLMVLHQCVQVWRYISEEPAHSVNDRSQLSRLEDNPLVLVSLQEVTAALEETPSIDDGAGSSFIFEVHKAAEFLDDLLFFFFVLEFF